MITFAFYPMFLPMYSFMKSPDRSRETLSSGFWVLGKMMYGGAISTDGTQWVSANDCSSVPQVLPTLQNPGCLPSPQLGFLPTTGPLHVLFLLPYVPSPSSPVPRPLPHSPGQASVLCLLCPFPPPPSTYREVHVACLWCRTVVICLFLHPVLARAQG